MEAIKLKVIPDNFPKIWQKQVEKRGQPLDILSFNNLRHFKAYMKNNVKSCSHASSNSHGNYDQYIDDLVKAKPVSSTADYKVIKDKVRTLLHKKGLISENVYEGYEYDVEGGTIDIARYLQGDPQCMLRPKVVYQNHFYELFISMAMLGHVDIDRVTEGLAKILATVQLLEQEHIYIKITAVACSSDLIRGKQTQMITIPLWSFRDEKTIEEMSSVLNERFFRTYCFAIKETAYGDKLSTGYGITIDLKEAIKPYSIDVVELATSILDKTITPGTR